jgi:prepilin-type N-terminal cleavage/methylation domain-containing protein
MKRRRKGFTLIELIVVIITITIIASVIFFAVNPAKRIGDAKNAVRDQNALELKKGIERLIADSLTVPNTLSTMTNGTYMLVTTGGSTAGQCSCTSLNQNIDRIDLAGLLSSYVPNLPVDDSASGNDTGYYIIKSSNNSFQTGSCYEYTGQTISAPAVPLVAASQGPNSPGTATSVTPGSWAFPNNCKVNDGTATVANTDDWDYVAVEQEARIVKSDATISAVQNKASLAAWGQVANPGYTTYGGSSDLWGETWTAADINDSDFGFVVKVGHANGNTGYLKMTNFGFTIPDGAVIDGIKVDIERWRSVDAGEDWVTVSHIVDHARITIYYRS